MHSWQKYERAMFNKLYYQYRSPQYYVRPNFKHVIGLLSKAKRQIDVAVFEQGNLERPYLAVECKNYKRKLNIKDIESFVGMRDDIGAQNGIIVSPLGFSDAAINRAEAANINTHILPLGEVERLNMRELIRQTFPWDEAFHPQMGDALFIFNNSAIFNDWFEIMESLPFEEWENALINFIQIDSRKAQFILRMIAQLHWDDAWRFNAIRLLSLYGWLDEILVTTLLQQETDPETTELLENNLLLCSFK
ncbi:MAG: restriction endonuclease [Tissierellales bacterium]|nr:restriction endonuclease [Tissierellales bacterium]